MRLAPLVERRGGAEGRAIRRCGADWQIGVAAEDGGEGGGEVAAGVGVVGQAEGHEQRAEVGVAEAERAVVVRVAAMIARWGSRRRRRGSPCAVMTMAMAWR